MRGSRDVLLDGSQICVLAFSVPAKIVWLAKRIMEVRRSFLLIIGLTRCLF